MIGSPAKDHLATTVLPLLARVTPERDESLMSLVARTCEANAFDRIAGVIGYAGHKTRVAAHLPFTGVSHADDLAALLSLSPDDVRRRMHPRLGNGPKALHVDWYGMPLERRFIEAERRRVSPASLRQSGHHRASWMIRPLSFCPNSLEFLVSDCPSCGEELGWKRTFGPARCEHCRAFLAEHSSSQVPVQLVEDASVVAALVSHSQVERSKALKRFPEPFSSWTPAEVFTAVFEMGAAWAYASGDVSTEDALRHGRGEFGAVRVEHLVRGVQALRAWPADLEPLVSGMWSIAPSAASDSLHSWLGPLGRHFRPRPVSSAFQRLLAADLPIAVRNARVPVRVSVVRRKGHLGRLSEICQKDAGTQLRVAKKTLRKLDRQGGALIAHRVNQIALYDRAALSASVIEFQEAVSHSSCAFRFGVPVYCLPSLADSGLIRPVTDRDALQLADGVPCFTGRSVSELDAAVSPPGDRLPCDVSLKDVMTLVFAPEAWAKIMTAVVGGTLRYSRDPAAGAPLVDQLFVDPGDVAGLLTAIDMSRFPEDADISLLSAGRILGVHDVMVGRFVSANVLRASAGSKRHRLQVGELAHFARQFAPTTELAKRLGCSGREVVKLLMGAGIAPAAAVERGKLWRRAEAERALVLSPHVGLRAYLA